MLTALWYPSIKYMVKPFQVQVCKSTCFTCRHFERAARHVDL